MLPASMNRNLLLLLMGLFSSLFGISKTPSTAAEPPNKPIKLNPAKIYPYIVPVAYLEHQAPGPEGLTYPLGHGLHVTLVHDLDGVARNVLGEELATANITPKQAHARASENLATLVKSGAVTIRRFDGPQGKPFIIFTHHWLSAACALLPDLRALATKNLGTESFCICLPQRDSMLLFPTGEKSFRSEIMAVIHKNEADARKPLSFGLFQLDAKGIQEFNDAK